MPPQLWPSSLTHSPGPSPRREVARFEGSAMQDRDVAHLGMPRLPQRVLGMAAVGREERVGGGEGMEMLPVDEEMGRERVMDGLGASRFGFEMVVLEK